MGWRHTFCEASCYKNNDFFVELDANPVRYELFHYRDREQREIDFLIEQDDLALLGIEVKAASVINPADFKHLKWFRDNLWAVPFGSLWAND